jgi:heme exporter protein CcmD
MPSHASFIVTAYGAAAMVFAALIAWIVIDYRALRAKLDSYEKRGLTRGAAKRARAAKKSRKK